MERRRRSSSLGQCRDCMRRRQVFRCGRKGGGSYRRGSRSYVSSICAECATQRLEYASPGSLTQGSWDIPGLEGVVASLGTAEAAEVLDRWRQRKANRRFTREARA